jgi:hypothetical protein
MSKRPLKNPQPPKPRPPRSEIERERRRARYLLLVKKPKLDLRPRCPGCGFPVYGRASMHPQCAVFREESQSPGSVERGA